MTFLDRSVGWKKLARCTPEAEKGTYLPFPTHISSRMCGTLFVSVQRLKARTTTSIGLLRIGGWDLDVVVGIASSCYTGFRHFL